MLNPVKLVAIEPEQLLVPYCRDGHKLNACISPSNHVLWLHQTQ